MGETAWNLLSDRIVRVRRKDGSEEKLSLPGVLSELQDGEVAGFPGLRVHQGHAWHAFLVQLAAIATHRFGEARTSEGWERRLRSLTDGKQEPWCLYVEDLVAPAFLQPPVPEGTLEKWKNRVRRPDEIDVLLTTKNHDVKGARMQPEDPEHWLFALLTLQTMQGYSGRGNYGIARMNGGYSSRPCLAFATALDASSRFKRDLLILNRGRASLLDDFEYVDEGGKALIWLEPWSGEKSEALSLSACDPYFIEICRRVRFVVERGSLVACLLPTKASRIDAKEANGNTGDPWTPVRDGKGLSVSANGFHYSLLQEILLGGSYRPGLALELQPDDPQELYFVASVLARGQGKTEGYHERILPVPGRIRLRLASAEGREGLGAMARERVTSAGIARLKVLKPALLAFLQGGPDELDWSDERANGVLRSFDGQVDAHFFERLWADADLEPGEATEEWEVVLGGLARAALAEAMESLPTIVGRSYRARSAAERTFLATCRKHLPVYFERAINKGVAA